MNKKSRNKLYAAVALIIVAILILAGVFVYYVIYNGKKEEVEEEEVFVLDDRISPNANQAIFVEVLRIRNRDLMDRMLSYGTSWKDIPRFYWALNVDGKEASTKGSVGVDGLFNIWDTIGEEILLTFDTEEEQEKSDLIITIVEEVKTGLLKRKTTDIIKEEIHLTYDYRTGRWTGDDSFKDKDGVGHYLGENYEVWFNVYQSDYDHDGIPYWIEANVLGTDPVIDDSVLDPDNDGIPTSWEWKWDYDPFVWNDHQHLDPDIDGIENIEEYQMRKYFSNPYQPDVYLEVDGMEQGKIIDLPYIFYKESQQMLIERYAQHGINLYIDDGWKDGPINGGGEMLPYHGSLDDIMGKMKGFYNHNFADERKGIFRYLVVGDYNGGFTMPLNYNLFDHFYVGNNLKAALTYRLAFTPRVVRVMLAKNVLHEMGHSFGMAPHTYHGIDMVQRSYSDRYPNMPDEEYEAYMHEYYSVMNYYYIYNKPFLFNDGSREYLFDYSDGSNGPPYDRNDWNYIYLPAFNVDLPSIEGPDCGSNFENFIEVDYYPGVTAEGWELDENLTKNLSAQFTNKAIVKNTDHEISVYIKTDKENESEYDVRVYTRPNVSPTFAIWSLYTEGHLDSEGNIEIYSQQTIISNIQT